MLDFWILLIGVNFLFFQCNVLQLKLMLLAGPSKGVKIENDHHTYAGPALHHGHAFSFILIIVTPAIHSPPCMTHPLPLVTTAPISRFCHS